MPALDAIESQCARHGATVTTEGMDAPSRERHARLAGHLAGNY